MCNGDDEWVCKFVGPIWHCASALSVRRVVVYQLFVWGSWACCARFRRFVVVVVVADKWVGVSCDRVLGRVMNGLRVSIVMFR